MEFKNIEDKKLKRLVDNLITNIEFGEHHRIHGSEQAMIESAEAKELLEILQATNNKKNQMLKDLIEQAKALLNETKNKVEALKSINNEELAVINEIKDNYHRLPNGILTYNEIYFKDRINLLILLGLTSNISSDQEILMKETEWEGYEQYKKNTKKK